MGWEELRLVSNAPFSDVRPLASRYWDTESYAEIAASYAAPARLTTVRKL